MHTAVLDFSTSFDKVPHKRFLKKLEYYGIHGTLLTWFECFITGRHQTVTCEGGAYKVSPVASWVPQGTFLDPLLFLKYVNDLPNGLHFEVKFSADDALLYGILANGVQPLER